MIKNKQSNAPHLIVKAKPICIWDGQPDKFHGEFVISDIIAERESIAKELERIVDRINKAQVVIPQKASIESYPEKQLRLANKELRTLAEELRK